MKPTAMFARLSRSTTLADSGSQRLEVQPPSLQYVPGSPWQRLMFWLLAPAPYDASPPLARLDGVRTDFLATIADIDSEDADRVRHRVSSARTLRELWHLRSDLYRLVGLAYSQSEAERRLLLLARHFPTRSPRSQLAPL